MRLQLVIRRHCLPTERVLLPVDGESSSNGSTTIARLLEKVNDIFPLESGEWGLEDYTVEVRGFECLHFSELAQVLKEDDEVYIRPLQSTDVRARRASGRSQILSGGTHLIDGVPFGRPYRGQSIRPPIPEIPPRKRRRLLYDTDYEEEEAQWDLPNERQIVLRDAFDNEDEGESLSDATSVEVSSQDSKDELEEDVDEELADLLEDQARVVAARKQSSEKGIDTAGLATPRTGLSRRLSPEHISGSIDQQAATGAIPSVLKQRKRKSSTSSNKSVRFEQKEPDTPATVRESEVSTDEELPPASHTIVGSEESDKENTEPIEDDTSESTSTISETSNSTSSESDPDSDSSEAESTDSDPDSLDDSSNSEEDSSALSESSDSEASESEEDSSEDDSSDPSSDESDISDEELSGTAKKTKARGRANRLVTTTARPEPTVTQNRSPVAPGQGKTKTQVRNWRRRRQNRLKLLKSKGELSEDATYADLDAYEGEQSKSAESFELAKNVLLSSLARTEGSPLKGAPVAPASNIHGEAPIDSAVNVREPDRAPLVSVKGANVISAKLTTPAPGNDTIPQSMSSGTLVVESPASDKTSGNKRRMKIDLASSRRMLFGSLGLSAPKSKEDEERIRAKLASQARPIPPSNSADSVSRFGQDGSEDTSNSEYENWQERIKLTAVECCHDGINLSTPPFPFVQRWDPQQQAGCYNTTKQGRNSRKNKKKRKRQSDSYPEETPYDDSCTGEMNAEEQPPAAKHTKFVGGNADLVQPVNREYGEGQFSLDRSGTGLQLAIDDQLQREVQEFSTAEEDSKPGPEDDLPPLPENLSEHQGLVKAELVPNMVIAFKKLDMSAQTNWQPLISGYKTAIITALLDDGLLELQLAARDAPKPRDLSGSGEIIYSKFDMPDVVDTTYAEDARRLEIVFAELIEPKIILRPQNPHIQNMSSTEAMQHNSDTILDGAGAPQNNNENQTHIQSAQAQSDGDVSSETVKSSNEPAIRTSYGNDQRAQMEQQVAGEVRDIIKAAAGESSINLESIISSREADHDLGTLRQGTLAVHEHQSYAEPDSPTFNGFGSGPPDTIDIQVPSSPPNGGNGDEVLGNGLNDAHVVSNLLGSEVPETVPGPAQETRSSSPDLSYSPSPPRTSKLPVDQEAQIQHLDSSEEQQRDKESKPTTSTRLKTPRDRVSKRSRHSHHTLSSPASELGISPPALRKPRKAEGVPHKSESNSSDSPRAPSPPPATAEQPPYSPDSEPDLPDLAAILRGQVGSQSSRRQASQISTQSVLVNQSNADSRIFTPRQRPSNAMDNESQVVDLLSSDDLEDTGEVAQGSKLVGEYESQVLPNGSGWVTKSQAQFAT